MRKRVVIGGLVAIAGIGFVLLVIYGPRIRLDYHIREYARAERELSSGEVSSAGKQQSFVDSVKAIVVGLPKRPSERYDHHEKALLDLGYLERQTFYLSNSLEKPENPLARLALTELPEARFWRIHTVTNGVLSILAERHTMKKWEEMVRKIDVPQSGK